MKIALVNGSPKGKDSVSALLLQELKELLGGAEFIEISVRPAAGESLGSLGDQDAVVFAFPTYVDGVPSHLLRALVQGEDRLRERSLGSGPVVYAIANCGFFEASQNRHSLAILESWCARTGLVWGQGVGIGAGPALAAVARIPPGSGPRRKVSGALRILAGRIRQKSGGENLFASPGLPRFLYRFFGELGWREQVRAHGLRPRDLALRR